ncbi:interactor of constitutive active ROPs 4-like isoform X2 [Zingiber officinale]|uniref:interactor of constitutive active ROPs 4-like isoform X2 n=1 Tax=Zingiber officinale TaxID=94328 RepID=UPI001C4A91A7|nr:interactor of constitutive active ROPs 4-like isoform X2 [Zingiber officinale]
MGSRGSSDAPQRPSPRAPLHLRSTACSEANSARRRAVTAVDGGAKVSPRGGPQERKRTTRAAELETKLSKAQVELKKLREQLAEAEAAKREAERALAKAKKRVPAATLAKKRKEEQLALSRDSQPEGVRKNDTVEESVTSPATMDVFEVVVPSESVLTEDEADSEQKKEGEKKEKKAMIDKTERSENNGSAAAAVEEAEERKKEDEKKNEEDEIGIWKAKLLEKEKEVAILLEENAIFKTRAEEEAKQIADSARSKQEEITAKLNSMAEQLKESKTKEKQLAAQLETAEGAKATLEMELKRLKVQTEQWRKAAEAAAEALATGDAVGGDEMGGRKVAERCRSMDKHVGGGGYGIWGSPLTDGDDVDDEDGGGGRKKGTGVRMFGNLWKKNQQK